LRGTKGSSTNISEEETSFSKVPSITPSEIEEWLEETNYVDKNLNKQLKPQSSEISPQLTTHIYTQGEEIEKLLDKTFL
jgi:hypothetical protein